MILAEAAGQGTEIAAQAFFYIAIAIAVIYFGWQFYKGAKEEGPLNTGWLTGPKKKDDASAEAVEATGTDAADEPEGSAAESADAEPADTSDADADEDDTTR
ncbi:hypothetical protein [Demequina sp. NBRC 110054]|uniref:hypothetical protein n=1 Tax=Demequina sp. NBRC 110054 TaxID=1570343 RepID=UPI000A0567F1|nr:hypothetical protein [Demequina sp. NBRC 110054]